MFKDLGAPIKEGMLQSTVIGYDENGERNTVYFTISQYEDSVICARYNIDTEEIFQYRAENHPDQQAKRGAWVSTTAGKTRVYFGTYYNGHLLQYDITTDTLTDLGNALEGETYIMGLCEDHNGSVYGSTFPGAKLFRMSVSDESIEDLGRFDTESMYLRNPHISKNGKVVATLGTKRVKVAVYDPKTSEKRVIDYPKALSGSLEIYADENGDIFITAKEDDAVYRLEDHTLLKVKGEAPKKAKMQFSKGRFIQSMDNKSVSVVHRDGSMKKHRFSYQSKGLMLWMVHKGPDEKIYGSSALPLRMFVYDPTCGKTENLGNPSTTDGEIYSMTNANGLLYIASYSGALLSVYDPAKPWRFGLEKTDNPRQIGAIGDGQNRPTCMITASNQMLYLASVPTYGQTKGALSKFDPVEETFTVWRGIAGEHSVSMLAEIEGTGQLCASTSNEVGTGAPVPQEDARLFVWDMKTEQKTQEIVPVKGAKRIVSIKYLDGLIYGFTGNGWLFAYDPMKNSICWSIDLPISHGLWPAMDITHHKVIYGGGDNQLFRFDVATQDYRVVARTQNWSLGFMMDHANHVIYVTDGARLLCYDIKQTEM